MLTENSMNVELLNLFILEIISSLKELLVGVCFAFSFIIDE